MSGEPTVEDPEPPTNWGRWGPNDERGTLNFITEQTQARGLAAAATGRVVSLAHPITPVPLAAAPVPLTQAPMPTPVLQMMNYTGSPPSALTDVLVITTHHTAMTHIDALGHIPTGDRVYPGTPLAEAVGGGTMRHGSTRAFNSGILTRGVLLDLAPEGSLPTDHSITGADLDAAAKRAATTLKSGDAIVVRGGWTVSEHLGKPLPGMTLDAVRWMAAHEISLYAGDIGDRPPTHPGQSLPLHQVGLARLGLPLIDGADVTELADTCHELSRWTFLLVVAAIPIIGATGVPVNPLAIF
jgi:kynurenine formamidase